MSVGRWLRHLFLPRWSVHRVFDAATLDAVESSIADCEKSHGGELRFAIESSLEPAELMRGVTPRERAIDVFGRLGVWDTEANNGVLIYVLWADRDVEIVADRGYNGRVSGEEWRTCASLPSVTLTSPPKPVLGCLAICKPTWCSTKSLFRESNTRGEKPVSMLRLACV